MKNKMLWISSFLISFVIVFILFVMFNLYTIGDIPTILVVMRYIASSIVGGFLLVLFKKFYDKYKEDAFMIISGFTLIPFILHFCYGILVNMFPNHLSASNAGAIGLLILFLYALLSVPCFILSIISLIFGKEKDTKIVSMISFTIWCLVLTIELLLFI